MSIRDDQSAQVDTSYPDTGTEVGSTGSCLISGAGGRAVAFQPVLNEATAAIIPNTPTQSYGVHEYRGTANIMSQTHIVLEQTFF